MYTFVKTNLNDVPTFVKTNLKDVPTFVKTNSEDVYLCKHKLRMYLCELLW
jgi:hypothetical protein